MLPGKTLALTFDTSTKRRALSLCIYSHACPISRASTSAGAPRDPKERVCWLGAPAEVCSPTRATGAQPRLLD
jgi:hypothetical protein